MRADFRQHCAAALTHMVTPVALATLLTSDPSRNRQWPDSRLTGKSSGLAWIGYAPASFTFALSFVTAPKRSAEQVAVAITDVGLRLLRAVFNTFQPLHAQTIRGLLSANCRRRTLPITPRTRS